METLFSKKFLKNYFVILLLIIVGFSIYANALPNKMFWDDNDGILHNQFIKNWQYFPQFFSENLIAGSGLLSNYWRPMLLTVFSFEWHLWRSWAPGYHFINIVFHITNAILLFLILLYLFGNRWLAVITSFIFLVHPLQTEAVTYVSGLGDPLSNFFIFLGIIFFIKFRISGKKIHQSYLYFSSLSMFIFALMSKETAIVMPAYLFLVDFFFLSRNEKMPFRESFKESTKATLYFFITAGIYIFLRATVLNFENTFNLYDQKNAFTSNLHIRLFTFFHIFLIYLRLIFWPLGLHMERSVNLAFSFNSFPVIFGAIIFFSMIVFAFIKFKKFPVVSFGILWFLIGLAPVSNILVPVSGLLYEHWLYLPLIGIFLSLTWAGIEIAKKYHLQKIFLIIFIIFFSFLSFLTIKRNFDWRDPITFYNQTLKYAPNSYRVINNLGMAYDDKKEYTKAEKMYKQAIAIDPKEAVAYHNLGNAYEGEGKTNLAIKNFEKAISLNPKFIFSYRALLYIYLKNKNYEKARKVLENYLPWSSSKVNTLLLLSEIATKEKKEKLALSYLKRAEKLDPKNKIIKGYITKIKDLIEFGQ